MNIRMTAVLTATALTLGACASPNVAATYRPIVDINDRTLYEADLAECRQLAFEEVQGSDNRAARLGFISTVFGGLVGLAIGADIGNTTAAIAGAAIGSAVGASASASNREAEVDYYRAEVIAGCMEGRGYRVLG
ncbi:MAG: hypothetical protein AAF367_11140 [Pseudomonadota bacterium]